METDTVVCTFQNASTAFNNYHGGRHSLLYQGDTMSYVQYPSDGTQIITERQFNNIVGGTSTVFPINDQYYAFIDKYGVFIHTYEKGDSEEVRALLF